MSDRNKDITKLRAELEADGYEGLYCPEEGCGCGIDDLAPCDMDIEGDHGVRWYCKPAYRRDCIGQDCAHPCDGLMDPGGDCFGPDKDGPKRKEPVPAEKPTERPARREYEAFTDVPATHYLPYITLRRLADAALAEADEAREAAERETEIWKSRAEDCATEGDLAAWDGGDKWAPRTTSPDPRRPGMSDKDFAISKREDKGWWVLACGQCGEEKTCYNFASAAAWMFKHMRCEMCYFETLVGALATLTAELGMKRREMAREGYFCEGCGKYAHHDEADDWWHDTEGVSCCPACTPTADEEQAHQPEPRPKERP